MTTTVFNESFYPSDWLKGESHGAGQYYSRDTITLAQGNGVLKTGMVLGEILLGAATSAVKASGANTGNGTLVLDAATPILAGAAPGLYPVRVTAAGANSATLRVWDPRGAVLGDIEYAGAGASATFADRIKFAVTDGTVDLAIGDGWDITIAPGSSKFVPVSATALDGSQNASAILFDKSVDTTDADQQAVVIRRMATVSHVGLSYGASINTAPLRAAVAAQLGVAGIVVRLSA